jgi:hypothetical protein
VNLVTGSLSQAANVFQAINTAPATSWQSAQNNPVNVTVASDALVDPVIDPTSPNATINVSGPAANPYLSYELGADVDLSDASAGIKEAATISTIVALCVITGSSLAEDGVAAYTDMGWFFDTTNGNLLSLDDINAFVQNFGEQAPGRWVQITTLNTGLIEAGLSSGAITGVESLPFARAAYYAIGGSPALTVDQGKVTWSESILGTATNSPTVMMKGGTLTLENNWIVGGVSGTQPLIQVQGGTLILGAPDGTGGNYLGTYGSMPFLHVTGTGMVVVEGGNVAAGLSSNFTGQAAGSTDTQLTSSAPFDVLGQPVTYTATVTDPGTPVTTGSVEFFDYTTHTYLQTVPVSNGTAALTVTPSAVTAGDTIVATYLPPTNAFVPSSGEATQAVVLATSVALSGPTPTSTPTYGQTLTFTATVTNTSGSGGAPTGSVEFYDGPADLMAGTPLSSSGNTATWTFTTANLTGGSHSINIVYKPTGNFEGGTATLTTFKVAPQATTTTLAASAPGTVPGQPVTFTATVAGTANEPALPGGTVQFKFNGQPYGQPVPLSASDTASVTITASATGSYTVSASYCGDTNYQPSVSTITITEPVLGPGVYPLSDELFVVGGASTSDSIAIVPAGSKTDGTTGLSWSGKINKASISQTVVQTFTAIVIYGGNGNNNVTLAPTLTLPTTILEGTGNDNVSGGNGATTVTAGSGNDHIQLASGNDIITLGDGNDNVALGDGTDNVTVGNGNDIILLGNGSDVVVEGNGSDSVTAGNGPDLVVGGLGQHTISLGNGNDILIDGSATVASASDSLRQILSNWNSSSSASVNQRLKVVYNTNHPNVLQAGSSRNWFFYKPPTTSNKKSTDFLN